MARMKRVYSIPLVVTVAASAIPACNADPVVISNPPAPCPFDLPEDGAVCWPDEARECEYQCPDGAGRTITRCVPIAEGGSAGETGEKSHTWESDRECEGQGGAGPGGAGGVSSD